MTLASRSVYQRLPVVLQNAACAYYGWNESRARLGPAFRARFGQLLESDLWSSADISAYQDAAITELVDHAYRTVPYYREVMRQAGLVPSDIKSRTDLAKLPVLTKEDVHQSGRALLSDQADRRRLVERHTSGTTGKSLAFFVSKESIAFQWAVWWRHRSRFGLSPDDWHVNFTGKLVVPPGQQKPPYWRWNPALRQVVVNMHHLTPSKVVDIVAFLNRRSFSFYSGYPSVIHAFALAADEAGAALESRPRVVVTGAENVLSVQRRDIQAVTGAILTDQYGLSEGAGNASQCSENVYHEDFEFGAIECVDPVPVGPGRVRGRIVSTGFACPDSPFIRYDTGDVGVWSTDGTGCSCGRRSNVLLEIEGRVDDYVLTPEGLRIMRFDYVFKTTSAIRECQVVQERPGAITLRIVRRREYSQRDERTLTEEIAKWISPTLAVDLEYVDEIERDPSGKFRAVQSRLRS